MKEKGKPSYQELKSRLERAEAALRAIRKGEVDTIVGEQKNLVVRLAEAEARETHIKRVLLAIRNVNQLIVAEQDRETLIKKACHTLTESMGYYNVWMVLLDEESKVTHLATSGIKANFQMLKKNLRQGRFPGCMQQVLEQKPFLVIDDPVTDCTACPLAAEYEDRAGLTHRLDFNGKVYGLISVSVPRNYADDEEEQELFRELAADLAFALYKNDMAEGRQIAEKKLKESQERLDLALNGADLGLWDWNIQTGKVFFNQRWAEMLGYRLDELEPNIKTWEKLVHPDDIPRVNRILKAHLDGKSPFYETEHRLRMKNGQWKWILDRGKVMARDAQGQAVRAAGTHLDISERKKMEQELRRKTTTLEERIKELNCLYGLAKLVETPEITIEDIYQGVVNLLPPAWQYPEWTCARLVIAGQEYTTENYRSPLWQQHCDIIVRGKKQGCLTVGYLTEKPEADEGSFITEEKQLLNAVGERLGRIIERLQSDEALQESEEKYRTLFESIRDAILVADNQRKIVDCNPAFTELFGYSLSDIKGQPTACIYKDDAEFKSMGAKIYAHQHAGKSFLKTIQYRRKSGQVFPGETKVFYLRNATGEISGLIGLIRDITQRKEAEASLQQRIREVRRMNRLMVGREKRMVALKEEVNQLSKQLGQPPKYDVIKANKEA